MSGDFNGPLSPIATIIAKHAAAPPPQKASGRITFGSLLLVACGYTAISFGPDALNQYPPAVLLGFAALSAFGVLLFIVGLRGPQMPPQPLTRFWSLLWAVAFAAASWWLAASLPDVWAYFAVRCFCISFAVAQAIDFLTLLRPMPSGAETLVNQNIAANEFNWEDS